MVSICVGTGSVLHCWQMLVFTSAYALNFINRLFGSLFWLPRVPIWSLFHEKLGPYWVPISMRGGPYKFGEQWETCDMEQVGVSIEHWSSFSAFSMLQFH